MFTRKNVTIIVSVAMIIILSSITYINASSPKDEKIAEKVEKRMELAYNDIITSFQFDKTTDGYTVEGYTKVKYVDALKMGKDIAREINLLDQMAPIGCTEPLYYINTDSKEVMILYKESDGTNVMLKSREIGDKWEKSEKKVEGTPILEINAN